MVRRALNGVVRRCVTDNCNVSISRFADATIALTESVQPIVVDPDGLGCLRHYSYGGSIEGQLSSAHPHLDHVRRRHYTYVLQFGRKSRYQLVSIDAVSGQQAIVATVPTDKPAYMHSFAMTERYLVLAEFPLVVNPLRLRFSGAPFIRNYRWKPGRGTRFRVVDKDTGRVVRSARSWPARSLIAS